MIPFVDNSCNCISIQVCIKKIYKQEQAIINTLNTFNHQSLITLSLIIQELRIVQLRASFFFIKHYFNIKNKIKNEGEKKRKEN